MDCVHSVAVKSVQPHLESLITHLEMQNLKVWTVARDLLQTVQYKDKSVLYVAVSVGGSAKGGHYQSSDGKPNKGSDRPKVCQRRRHVLSNTLWVCHYKRSTYSPQTVISSPNLQVTCLHHLHHHVLFCLCLMVYSLHFKKKKD